MIEGVDVWSRQWVVEKDAPHAEVKDPRYGQRFSFRVYHIESAGRKTRFAAGEFSNSIFGFYVPRKSLWFWFAAIFGIAKQSTREKA